MTPDTLVLIKQLIEIIQLIWPIILAILAWAYTVYHKIKNTAKSLDIMMKEFKPNGGGSLRDAVNRIETRLSTVDMTQKAYIDADSDVPIFQTDVHGKCTWCNKSYLKLVDRQLHEIIGSGWEIAMPQSEREHIRREWCLVDQNKLFEYKYKFIDNSGKHMTATCKIYGDNKSGYIGFIYSTEE